MNIATTNTKPIPRLDPAIIDYMCYQLEGPYPSRSWLLGVLFSASYATAEEVGQFTSASKSFYDTVEGRTNGHLWLSNCDFILVILAEQGVFL